MGDQIAAANSKVTSCMRIFKGMMFLWKLQAVGACAQKSFQAHSTYITKCIYSPDSRYQARVHDGSSLLATLSADSTAKLWKSASIWNHTDEPLPSVDNTEGSPSPSTASACASSSAPVQTLAGHTRWVWDGAFSADSAYFVTGASDGTARLWDIARAETVCMYAGHQKAITAIAMNDLTGAPEA